MLKSKKFDYDRQSLKALDKLKEIAEFEGHLDGHAKMLVDSLRSALEPNLGKDLESMKTHVKKYLEGSIVSRYYYRRGVIERELIADPIMKEADSLLSDEVRYRNILKPSK